MTDHLMRAWELDPSLNPYGASVEELILAEREVPIQVGVDRSLRAKVIDACGMTCTFCHNEGTPVAVDERRKFADTDTGVYSGRVSVFAATNGVDFVPGVMMADDNLRTALVGLRDMLDLNELHLTGGEPTLSRHLKSVISMASQEGYVVKMTSNGENGAAIIPKLADVGLSKVNFSIFGTTPEELASVQNSKYRDAALANKKINALHRSIEAAAQNGIGVSANIVVGDDSHFVRLDRILNEFEPKLELRLLPDLDKGHDSYFAIYRYLERVGAKPVVATVEAGSSNARVRYETPEGRSLIFKQIRPARLPDTCRDCRFNDNERCKEGYYGVRLYVDDNGQYKVGVCIQRMDLMQDLGDFIGSRLVKEIVSYKQEEYGSLVGISERNQDHE